VHTASDKRIRSQYLLLRDLRQHSLIPLVLPLIIVSKESLNAAPHLTAQNVYLKDLVK